MPDRVQMCGMTPVARLSDRERKAVSSVPDDPLCECQDCDWHGKQTELGLHLECTKPNPRPTRATAAMVLQAASNIAEELVKADPDLGEVSEVAADIAHVTRHCQFLDGYEIARDLEQYRHWDCNFEICEILDGFSSECSHLVRQAEKAWGKENPLEPPYPVGTLVDTRHGRGVIREVFEHAVHSYIVPVGGHDLIIPFEDVKPAPPEVVHETPAE